MLYGFLSKIFGFRSYTDPEIVRLRSNTPETVKLVLRAEICESTGACFDWRGKRWRVSAVESSDDEFVIRGRPF